MGYTSQRASLRKISAQVVAIAKCKMISFNWNQRFIDTLDERVFSLDCSLIYPAPVSGYLQWIGILKQESVYLNSIDLSQILA